jgi:hypothetical protein
MIAVVQDRIALPSASADFPHAEVPEPSIVEGIVALDPGNPDDDTDVDGEEFDLMPRQRYSARRLTERIEASR